MVLMSKQHFLQMRQISIMTKNVFFHIKQAVQSRSGILFFVGGPCGRGKAFLFNTLFGYIH